MSNHNHTGSIWNNVTDGVRRHTGPGTDYEVKDTLPAGQSLIVLCYSHNSHGIRQNWTTPGGQPNMSDAWDFVVTGDLDPGGYVADVYVNTGGDITQQLGGQGTCDALRHNL